MKRLSILLCFLTVSLAVAACNSGQLFGPMMTPTPTNTATSTHTSTPADTPTPIPIPEGIQYLPLGVTATLDANGVYQIILKTENEKVPIPATMDTAGIHIILVDGSIVDVPTDQIAERVKAGLYSPFQIYNETGTAISYAYDAENKVWIKASDVLQPDNSNAANYIKYDTIDDWLKSVRLEKMVVIPFDPDKTYFPELDKMNVVIYDKNFHDTNSEFNYDYPFGKLPENMQSPFRFVNFVNVSNGKLYGYTEQVYNPADGSFTLIHGILDNIEPIVGSMVNRITNTADKRFILPSYSLNEQIEASWVQSTTTWLEINGYIDSSGNMPKIKAWIDKWLITGYLSPEIENIPIYTSARAFRR